MAVIEALEISKALHRLAVEAFASHGWDGSPFRRQFVGQLRCEAALIGQPQGATPLDQLHGALVLNLRAKLLQAHRLGYGAPGGGQKLVGTGGSAGKAAGTVHLVWMAIEIAHQAAAEHGAVALVAAIGPGALCIANRV